MESVDDSGIEELPAEPLQATPTAGEQLRAAREERGLELEHVAAETRIPVRHLETIEAGNFDQLPSRTYAIGFARTYARTLELDERQIADKVREELADGYGRQSALAGGMEPGDPAKLPSRGLAWAGAGAALLLAVGVIAFYNTYFAAGTGPRSLIAQAEEEARAERAAAQTAAQARSSSETAVPQAGGQVVFTAQEDLWVRFYDKDYAETGEPLFEGTMASGDTFEVPKGADTPLINTGRPDAFAITIDGQTVPKLAEVPVTIGDAPISAEALLARAEPGDSPAGSPNAGGAGLN